jgi:hypothetical protein
MDHCLLHFKCFPIAAMHWSNLLIYSRKTASKVSTLISSRISRTPERSSSAGLNGCPWRQFLRWRKEKPEGSKSSEYGGCGAIRKTLSLQNILVTFAICCLALSAYTTNLLSPLSTPSNDFGEIISDIIDDREYLAARHVIENLEFMGIPGECEHQFPTLNHVLLPIGDCISIWEPDHLMICR